MSMRNLKLLYTLLIVFCAGLIASCTNDNTYSPGELPAGPQVSFMPNNDTVMEFTGNVEENSRTLTLTRIDKEEALNVWLLVEIDKGAETLFSIPDVVSFAAGEATAKLNFTVNQELFENDKEYNVHFAIADEKQTTPYGHSEWTIKFALNPWEQIKDEGNTPIKGKFRGLSVFDNIVSEYDLAPYEVDVDIYKHKTEEKYMIKEPWALLIAAFYEGMTGESVPAESIKGAFDYTPQDVIIDVTDKNNVVLPLQSTGLNDTSNFWYNNIVLGDFFYQGTGGTLEDGIITFPAGGLFCNCGYYRQYGIADDDPGYCAGANGSGTFRVILPGYEAADYSLGVAYDGMNVTADGVVTAKFKFTYGDDVTGIKYMIVAGNVASDPSNAVNTLLADTDENILTVENFEKGGKEVGVSVNLESGLYTIVAAPADKNGNLREKEVVVMADYFKGVGATEKHPCNVGVIATKFSVAYPDYADTYPDTESLAFCIYGDENDPTNVVTDVKFTYLPTAKLNEYIEGGATLEDIIKARNLNDGQNYKVDLEQVNSANGWVSYALLLNSDTEYTIAVLGTNIYGESAVATTTHTTDAIDYNGELVIGKYLVSCTVGAGTENESKFENVITVVPNGTTGTDFIVKNFGANIEDLGDVNWLATYDATASTLTLSGLEYKYESYGCQFGVPYAYVDANQTQVLAYFSYASETSEEGNDPCVLNVDPTTKQVCGLQNMLFAVQIVDMTTYNILATWGYYLGASTTITPYSEGATASVKSTSVRVPFSSVSISKLNKLSNKVSTTAVNWSRSSNKTLRTVKPTFVENYTPVKPQGFQKVEKANFAPIAR